MPIFKRKSPEIIDLTELQKKGTLQRSRRIAKINSEPLNSEEVVDLSLPKKIQEITSMPKESSPLGDFLSNLASANSSQESGIQAISSLSGQKSESNTAIQELKIKLDDLEYKLNSFLSRLSKIEEKLGK